MEKTGLALPNKDKGRPSLFTITHVGSIDDQFVNAVISIVNGLNPLPIQLQLNISSPGGDTRAGITAYNYLKQLPCTVHTHNLGEVSSAAVLPFLAGSIRTADDVAKFVLHPATLVINKSISWPQLQELQEILDGDIRNYATIIEKELPLFCKKHDIRRILHSETVTLTPLEGFRVGLLTDASIIT